MLTFGGRPLDATTTLRDGTHRSATLEQTWARFAPAAKRAGITRLADLTGLDTLGIPVFAAIRPLGRSLSTQQGKGITPLAAKVSALMESLETWTAEHVLDGGAHVRGSYRALRNRRLRGARETGARPTPIDVRALPRAPGRLDLDATWTWIEGRDLVTDTPVLVPLDSVTLDCVFSKPPVFDVSSNGLASGNVLAEAILHGLCEVLERDAEAAWRRAGGDRRLVLDSISDPICSSLIDRIVRSGVRVFVWDLGATEVCAIGCAIVEDPREPSWRELGCYQGFGAHLMPEVAIARALTEAAQTRLTYIAGARDDFFPADYARATDREVVLEVWERLAAPCDEPTMFDDLPRFDAPTLGCGLADLVARVVESGGAAQVIAVDLTHPKLRVPVAKVLVPGRATDLEAMG
ncbi:MAG: YcaO-like family protein [Deltaproteobacteria bacterium]|nr:YcaO-like family protein [Deltaproteobacteria bacterium]